MWVKSLFMVSYSCSLESRHRHRGDRGRVPLGPSISTLVMPGWSRGGFSMNRCVRLLSIGLLLGLASSPAWGQPSHQPTVGAPEHDPSGQPREVASGIPVDDFDRGTPRRAVEGFLQVVRAQHFRQAAAYLDLRDFTAEEAKTLGPQLARRLKIVLNQQVPIHLERISDSPTGFLEDGLPPDLEQLGRIDTPERPIHLRLQRVPREDGVMIWKLSAASVAMI